MSDHEFIASLYKAAREDVATDEAGQQARLEERVLGAPRGGGGGEGATPRLPRSHAALGIGVLALAVGGVCLATSGWWSRAPIEQRPTAAAETRAPPPPAAARPEPQPAEVSSGASVWELPSAAERPKPAASSSDASDELALEISALAAVRKTLRRGDAAGALGLLDQFDQRFPRARTRDEATVARIEVLFALGRKDDARQLATAFAARQPDSLYRARVAQILGETR